MRTAELDAWLPAPAIRTHHRRSAQAPEDLLWEAARAVRLEQTRTVGRLVQWRLPGTPARATFGELLAEDPFTLLAEGERWSLSGLCGRIWTLSRDYPRLRDAAAFRDWDERGTVRVLFAHWVEPDPERPGRSTLVSEARVEPVDRGAGLALRSLWVLVGVFERRIGSEPLALAAQRAEAMADAEAAARPGR